VRGAVLSPSGWRARRDYPARRQVRRGHRWRWRRALIPIHTLIGLSLVTLGITACHGLANATDAGATGGAASSPATGGTGVGTTGGSASASGGSAGSAAGGADAGKPCMADCECETNYCKFVSETIRPGRCSSESGGHVPLNYTCIRDCDCAAGRTCVERCCRLPDGGLDEIIRPGARCDAGTAGAGGGP
jgi:hypothetical protein